jgi:hypothetical protein
MKGFFSFLKKYVKSNGENIHPVISSNLKAAGYDSVISLADKRFEYDQKVKEDNYEDIIRIYRCRDSHFNFNYNYFY